MDPNFDGEECSEINRVALRIRHRCELIKLKTAPKDTFARIYNIDFDDWSVRRRIRWDTFNKSEMIYDANVMIQPMAMIPGGR